MTADPRTPHQIIIARLEREQERIRRLLDDKSGLEQADSQELEELAEALDALAGQQVVVAHRLRLLSERVRDGR